MSLITCSVFSGRVAEGMACKPYLEDLLTAFATQFAKQLFFFQYITDKAGHQTVKKSMTENLNVMYSTIVTDASVLFLITIFVHSRFNISCKFCFLLLFIVQQIVPVPVHRFLARKSCIFITTKANYPFLARKTFFNLPSSLFSSLHLYRFPLTTNT